MELTERQRRFADEYIRTGKITESALNAGYSEKTARQIGQQNLSKLAVKNYIDKRIEELKKGAIADQDEILQFLTKVVRGEQNGATLLGIGQGAQVVDEMPPTLAEQTKAAELLGKRYAMWTDKQDITQRTLVVNVGEYDDNDHD
jgi:phage terminase small subunit